MRRPLYCGLASRIRLTDAVLYCVIGPPTARIAVIVVIAVRMAPIDITAAIPFSIVEARPLVIIAIPWPTHRDTPVSVVVPAWTASICSLAHGWRRSDRGQYQRSEKHCLHRLLPDTPSLGALNTLEDEREQNKPFSRHGPDPNRSGQWTIQATPRLLFDNRTGAPATGGRAVLLPRLSAVPNRV